MQIGINAPLCICVYATVGVCMNACMLLGVRVCVCSACTSVYVLMQRCLELVRHVITTSWTLHV